MGSCSLQGEVTVSMFEFEEEPAVHVARIKVVGVGGAGGSAINRMIDAGLTGVDFIAVNTDAQVLGYSKSPVKVQIGAKLTRGLGSGGDPEIGRKAIEEDREKVLAELEESDMVFITCGEGGGTGTGAAPIVADVAKEVGALTVGVGTKPFDFEGRRRMHQAEIGISELKNRADTLIVIPNQRLLSVVGKQTPICEAFRVADDVLLQATRGVSDLVTTPGLINLDFADVRTIMSERGDALLGTGVGTGENRAVEAAQEAISCPLLDEITISGARGVLVNITGGDDLTLFEANEAASVIAEASGGEAHIIFGAVISPDANGTVRVTVIATGLNSEEESQAGEARGPIDIHARRREDLERPAFKRRERSREQQVIVQRGKVDSFDQDDLEVPTFLRRQVD